MADPRHIRWELPDGGGVVLSTICAFCEEPPDSCTVVCPICQRTLCAEPCFHAHLVARDAADADADPLLLEAALQPDGVAEPHVLFVHAREETKS
jgi:hypothetical protein